MRCKYCKEHCGATPYEVFSPSVGHCDEYLSDCCNDTIMNDDLTRPLTETEIANELHDEEVTSYVSTE